MKTTISQRETEPKFDSFRKRFEDLMSSILVVILSAALGGIGTFLWSTESKIAKLQFVTQNSLEDHEKLLLTSSEYRETMNRLQKQIVDVTKALEENQKQIIKGDALIESHINQTSKRDHR